MWLNPCGYRAGYALEFDTRRLENLNQKLGNTQAVGGTFAPVAYEHTVEEKNKEIEWFICHLNKVLETTEQFMKALWFNKNEEEAGEILDQQYEHFFKVISLLKHRAYFEEREVRIVYAPTKISKEYEKLCAVESQEVPKEIGVNYFERSGKLVPYVSLYEELARDPSFRLPIKRIIVGPHLDKDSRAAALQSLVAKDGIEVTISDIPYLP